MSKIIKSEEVAKHKTKTSTWVIIHNNIYNLTKFLDEHPGGADSILDFAGKDGTVAFEDVGHSQDARDMMKKYKIGSLPPDEHTTNKTRCGSGDTWKYALLAIAGLVLTGFIVKKYVLK